MSFKNDCRRLIALLIWVLWIPNILANTQSDTIREDNSFIRRFSIHTNALHWFLTVPNAGVEFDFQNSEENRFSILLQGGYNWNSSHSFNPRYVMNVANVSLEVRKYWRTGGTVGGRSPFSKYEIRDTTISRFRWFFQKFRRNVLSGRTLRNPRIWRAYYVGLYGGYDQYSLACFGKGIQGKSINLGVSGGWSKPIIILKGGRSVDLDLGVTVGVKITRFDRYHYVSETGCYEFLETKPLHLIPYPVVHDIRIGLAYRFRSIARKVQGEADRYNIWDSQQSILRAKRRVVQDSLFLIRQKEEFLRDSVKAAKNAEKELKQKKREEQKKLKAQGKESKKTTVDKEKMSELPESGTVDLDKTSGKDVNQKVEKKNRRERKKKAKDMAKKEKNAKEKDVKEKKSKNANKSKEKDLTISLSATSDKK